MVGPYDWVVDQFPYAVVVVDTQNYVVRCNSLARQLFGQAAEPGSRFPQRHPAGQHRLPSPEAGASGLVVESRGPAVDGHWLYVFREDAQVAWVSEDTERLAFEDPLTGLPNWNILQQFVDHSCSQSQRYGRSAALLRLDLEHLRHVNSEMGRAAGDEVLLQTAQRLQNNVRSSDIVGRLEGDRFLILLTELSSDRGANRGDAAMPVRSRAAVVAQRLIQAFRAPFALTDSEVTCPAAVGVAVCPEDAKLSSEWLEAAELALARSKSQGGDSFELYAEALKQEHQVRQDRHKQLELALKEQQLDFEWFPIEGPEPLEHYWWRWQQASIVGPQVRDWLDSAGLQAAWGKWEKAHIMALDGTHRRLAPLAPVWLNPGVDGQFLLNPQWLWEVEEGVLHHRYRLESLLKLQERGLTWVLRCSSRGLQNLGLLGRLQPNMLKIPIPRRPNAEQQRLLLASAQLATSLGIEVMLEVAFGAEVAYAQTFSARWIFRAPE